MNTNLAYVVNRRSNYSIIIRDSDEDISIEYVVRFALYLIAVIIMTLMLIMIYRIILPTENNDSSNLLYKSIQVSSNDSLLSIADIYAGDNDKIEYINDIIRINSLSGSDIMAGMYLVIPYEIGDEESINNDSEFALY